jgi:hypothetical protein
MVEPDSNIFNYDPDVVAVLDCLKRLFEMNKYDDLLLMQKITNSYINSLLTCNEKNQEFCDVLDIYGDGCKTNLTCPDVHEHDCNNSIIPDFSDYINPGSAVLQGIYFNLSDGLVANIEYTIEPLGRYNNGTNKPISAVLSISGTLGTDYTIKQDGNIYKVTFLKEGNYNIKISTDNEEYSKDVIVGSTENIVAIEIMPKESVVYQYTTTKYKVYGQIVGYDQSLDITTSVAFSVTNGNIAKIVDSEDGSIAIYAIAPGETTLVAQFGTFSAISNLTVNECITKRKK